MADTTTDPGAQAPIRPKSAVVNFPTETPMSEYADAAILHARGVDDDAMAQLGGFTHLEQLLIDGDLSDAGLAHLREFKNLGSLELTSPNVTDDGLLHLGELAELETLQLTCPGVKGRGLRAFAGASKLTTVRLDDCHLSPKGARVCIRSMPASLKNLTLQGRTLGIDHLVMMRGAGSVEQFDFSGGGDIFGGGDGHLDRVSALELVNGSPNLQEIKLSWWNGKPMISGDTIVSMIAAKPGITVNGTWYDAKVFESTPVSGTAGGSNGSTGSFDGQLVEIDETNFDAVIDSSRLALVYFYTSNQDICKASVVFINAMGTAIEQLPPVLAGKMIVGRLDEHTTGDLTAKVRERFPSGAHGVTVFKGGELVGRIGAWSAQGILDLLGPVLGA